jgi:hypothetical protein
MLAELEQNSDYVLGSAFFGVKKLFKLHDYTFKRPGLCENLNAAI